MKTETKIKEMSKARFLKRVSNAQLWALANEMLINGVDIVFTPKQTTKKGVLAFSFHKNGRFGYVKKQPWGNYELGILVKGYIDYGKTLFGGVEYPRLDHVLSSLRAQTPLEDIHYLHIDELPLEGREILLIKSK